MPSTKALGERRGIHVQQKEEASAPRGNREEIDDLLDDQLPSRSPGARVFARMMAQQIAGARGQEHIAAEAEQRCHETGLAVRRPLKQLLPAQSFWITVSRISTTHGIR